jgi:hypothetical protein
MTGGISWSGADVILERQGSLKIGDLHLVLDLATPLLHAGLTSSLHSTFCCCAVIHLPPFPPLFLSMWQTALQGRRLPQFGLRLALI